MQKKKDRIKNHGYVLFLVFYTLCLTGCATTSTYTGTFKPETAIPGIYHRVLKGETLWKISKMYGVDLDDIIRANRIPDAASIEIGQLISIPSGQKQYGSAKYNTEDFIWPIKGRVITGFGQVNNNMINKGLNIQPSGSTDVVAARSGKITFYSEDFAGYGKTIIIEHGDGFSTVYSRNSDVFIKVGDDIQKGMLIAKAGSAGRDKLIYLHFEIRKGYIPQNPYFYLTD